MSESAFSMEHSVPGCRHGTQTQQQSLQDATTALSAILAVCVGQTHLEVKAMSLQQRLSRLKYQLGQQGCSKSCCKPNKLLLMNGEQLSCIHGEDGVGV